MIEDNSLEERAGLKLTKETSVGVSWKTLLSSTLDAIENAIKASQGDLLSAGKMLINVLEGVGAVEANIPVASRALELIILSYALAVDYTSAAHPEIRNDIRSAMKEAVKECKRLTEEGKATIPFDFFDAPHRAHLYCMMRDKYINKVFTPTLSASAVMAERHKLDQAFRAAVWELWHSRRTAFDELSKVLGSPAAEISDFDRQWRSYRAKLIAEFNVKPVFGQEESLVSLANLYVPLRCSWISKGHDLATSFERAKEQPEEQFLCIDWLEKQLFEWLDNDDPHDWLRLIGGGPGSGKSTTAKAFVAKAAERLDVQPLFIPLQRLETQSKLRDAINNYFMSRTGSAFLVPPLERRFVESSPRLLLVFDGLDEIARPGESANVIARDMVDRIRTLYNELTGDGNSRHKILVTGRTVSFDAARQTADRKGHEALEVVNYANITRPNAVAMSTDRDLLKLDQRPIWWEKYSSVLNRSPEIPEAFADERLDSITSEPLLCYLFALSGYLEENAKEAASNRSRIYLRLLEDVWRRGWGGGRAGPGRQLHQADFDRLFESMALAAWHGGDERLATYDRFERALAIMKATAIFENFNRSEGGDVSNLAVNFYLKHADASGKGFEFTHKTFGEYLAARAVFRIADGVVALVDIREELAIEEWLKGIATGALSYELIAFLKDEARLRVEKSASSCADAKKKLERVFSKVQVTGFPAAQGRDVTWREAEKLQNNAEAMLLAVINALAGAISEYADEICYIEVDWPNEFALGQLIHRQRGVRNQDIPVSQIFSHISARHQTMLGIELINFDFSYSKLENTEFFRSILLATKFDGAVFKDVTFMSSVLSRSSFTDADFQGAEFGHCEGEESDFARARLAKVTFDSCVLDGSDFQGAVFVETRSDEDSLKGVKLDNGQFGSLTSTENERETDLRRRRVLAPGSSRKVRRL